MKILLVLTFLVVARGDCPSGFTYLYPANSCFKVIYEKLDWVSAGQKCQNMGAQYQLAVVEDGATNCALKTFLGLELDANIGFKAGTCLLVDWIILGHLFWIGGQRQVENNCTSDFVWKPTTTSQIPFTYTDWAPDEPNCGANQESCVHVWSKRGYTWNDMSCDRKFCAVCEFKP